jgi:hypothetical protein
MKISRCTSQRSLALVSAMLAVGLFGPGVSSAQAETSGDQAVVAADASSGSFVDIPADYVYEPSLGALHDYCTDSPSYFPGNPAADFRGPCARHDMCYEAHVAGKSTCDNNLFWDLYANCEYTYSAEDSQRGYCETDAGVYWAAVTEVGGY